MRIYKKDVEKGDKIHLTKDEKRHTKALRLRSGDTIYVFDGRGKEYKIKYDEKVREYELGKPYRDISTEGRKKITLAISPSKGYRMDFLIEKVSEIGVDRIIPTICERSIVKPRDNKIDRWKKIAIEGCSQSGNLILPEITRTENYDEIIEKVSDYDEAYICHKEKGEERGDKTGRNALIIVGPEGGFSEKELEKAADKGIKRLKLSDNALRVETAGIVGSVKMKEGNE